MTRAKLKNVDRLLAEKERATREAQAVISRGEELLDRAHQLAKSIESHVRQALGETADSVWPTAPASPILRMKDAPQHKRAEP